MQTMIFPHRDLLPDLPLSLRNPIFNQPKGYVLAVFASSWLGRQPAALTRKAHNLLAGRSWHALVSIWGRCGSREQQGGAL
jgi:hypothetical protein